MRQHTVPRRWAHRQHHLNILCTACRCRTTAAKYSGVLQSHSAIYQWVITSTYNPQRYRRSFFYIFLTHIVAIIAYAYLGCQSQSIIWPDTLYCQCLVWRTRSCATHGPYHRTIPDIIEIVDFLRLLLAERLTEVSN